MNLSERRRFIVEYSASGGAFEGRMRLDCTSRQAAERLAGRRIEMLLGIRMVDLDYIRAKTVAEAGMLHSVASQGSGGPSV